MAKRRINSEDNPKVESPSQFKKPKRQSDVIDYPKGGRGLGDTFEKKFAGGLNEHQRTVNEKELADKKKKKRSVGVF